MVDLCCEKGMNNLQVANCIPKWADSFVCDVVKNTMGFLKNISSKITVALL